MMQRVFARLLALLCAACLVLSFAVAQTAPPAPGPQQPAPAETRPDQGALPADIAAVLARLTGAIANAEKSLQQLAELEEDLGRLRGDVENILDDSRQTAESLRPRLAEVKSQIERLGPPPAKDAPPEPPGVATERARLTALSSAIDGAIKTSELTWVRARQLIEKITVLRHSLFTKNLMERQPSPLLPWLWRDLTRESPAVGHRLTYLATDWWGWANARGHQLAALAAVAALLFLILQVTVSRVTDRRSVKADGPPPSFFERGRSVAWVAPLRALPTVAAAALLYWGLDTLELLYAPWGRVAGALLAALTVFAAVASLLSAIIAPSEPQWRLFSLADRPARRVFRLLVAIAAVYAADVALTDANRAFFAPLSLTVVQSFATSMAFAVLLIGLLLTPFQPQGQTTPVASRHTPRWLKIPLWIVVIGIVAAAMLGYVALARFAAQQLMLTGIVVVVGWLGYLAIRALTREPPPRVHPLGEVLETRLGIDATRRGQLARLTELTLTGLLLLCALPILMLQWGFSGDDVRDFVKSLVFGLEIGQFKVSVARILLGILLFVGLLLVTRLIQRLLRERALNQTRMDPGIINSVDTVVGYAGIALAALLAISYAGFDITNIAIVAGALSVGIGFGLQSIVNNFVSGLILLVERPIKVGDWIVVGSEQGNVRRISVRATEIETFDRASLLVPNSELITGRVLNWTHRNSVGRVILRVGVSYSADPEEVLRILRQCAEDHPDVLRTPEPGVVFENFGASALEFALRIYLADISQTLRVQSELRVAILKALRAAGIEIPFNQVDINLRDLDGIKRLVNMALGEPDPSPGDPDRPRDAAGNSGKKDLGPAR